MSSQRWIPRTVFFVNLSFLALTLVSTTTAAAGGSDSPPSCFRRITSTFLDWILTRYGENGTLDQQQLSAIVRDASSRSAAAAASLCPAINGTAVGRSNRSSACHPQGCLNTSILLDLYLLSNSASLSKEDLWDLSPALLYQVLACGKDGHKDKKERKLQKSMEAWAYGFLFVTLISICSLAGIIVLPIMKTQMYKKVLLFLVALAVGSLAGTGLLVLIPEAFGLLKTQGEKREYLWKSTTIMCGIYLFFLIERVMKLIMRWKKEQNWKMTKTRKTDSQSDFSNIVCSIKSKTPVYVETAKMKNPGTLPTSASGCTMGHYTQSDDSISGNNDEDIEGVDGSACQLTEFKANGYGSKVQESKAYVDKHGKREIATVAWMIIFGDGLHNFIDGLSIGAAFTEHILVGISVSLAVICEELPHELGDFAILLNSGMTMKKALLFNFLSACMCYLGLILGIILGENTAAHDWIFGLAGGMFLYISLVDMMPEMNTVIEVDENRDLGKMQLFLLQNIGMVLGFVVILLMVIYSEQINLGRNWVTPKSRKNIEVFH